MEVKLLQFTLVNQARPFLTHAPPTFCIKCPGMREYPRPLLLSKIHTCPQGTWGEGLSEIRHIREVLEEVVGGERVRCEGVEEGEGGGELQGESEEEERRGRHH